MARNPRFDDLCSVGALQTFGIENTRMLEQRTFWVNSLATVRNLAISSYQIGKLLTGMAGEITSTLGGNPKNNVKCRTDAVEIRIEITCMTHREVKGVKSSLAVLYKRTIKCQSRRWTTSAVERSRYRW